MSIELEATHELGKVRRNIKSSTKNGTNINKSMTASKRLRYEMPEHLGLTKCLGKDWFVEARFFSCRFGARKENSAATIIIGITAFLSASSLSEFASIRL